MSFQSTIFLRGFSQSLKLQASPPQSQWDAQNRLLVWHLTEVALNGKSLNVNDRTATKYNYVWFFKNVSALDALMLICQVFAISTHFKLSLSLELQTIKEAHLTVQVHCSKLNRKKAYATMRNKIFLFNREKQIYLYNGSH